MPKRARYDGRFRAYATRPSWGRGSGDYEPPVACSSLPRLDLSKPTQSLRNAKGDVDREVLKAARATTYPDHAFACFHDMVKREQEHFPEFLCFYHSYSFAAIIYEVQAELARHLYGLDEDFAPLPRILKAPFDGRPTLELLLSAFSKMASQDHDPKFREVAISCSVSLLGYDTEAPPLSCFQSGYSCADLSFSGLLTSLLGKCGLDGSRLKRVVDEILRVAAKYGLCGAVYGGSDRGGTEGEMSGHLLQIFVHKSVVDDIAYASHAYGVINPKRQPVGAYLSRADATSPVAGQARLFMHPTIFTDTTKAKVYHYCADPSYSAQRGSFIRELRKAMEPLVGDYKSVRRAFEAVEAISK